eukprot:3440_1
MNLTPSDKNQTKQHSDNVVYTEQNDMISEKHNKKTYTIAIELAAKRTDEIKEHAKNKSVEEENKYSQYVDDKYVEPLDFENFPPVRADDYIYCDTDFVHCPVVHRILHLLK